MRACTAAVVELAFNAEAEGSAYTAEVEFLGEEEWMVEVESLCAKLTGPDGIFQAARPDPDTPAYEAWWQGLTIVHYAAQPQLLLSLKLNNFFTKK
jgi:hypothetical protein